MTPVKVVELLRAIDGNDGQPTTAMRLLGTCLYAYCERNTVRAAYNRAQHWAERRVMMQNWADYLD